MKDSPLLNTKEAAAFCKFTDTKRPERNFLRWVYDRDIPTLRRGKKVFVYEHSLVTQMQEDAKAARDKAKAKRTTRISQLREDDHAARQKAKSA